MKIKIKHSPISDGEGHFYGATDVIDCGEDEAKYKLVKEKVTNFVIEGWDHPDMINESFPSRCEDLLEEIEYDIGATVVRNKTIFNSTGDQIIFDVKFKEKK